jgi:hypothetical protein
MPREKSEERPVRHQRCWEYLACTTVLCPAHGEYDQDCWLVPGTVCSQPPGGDFFLKLYACLSCAYFKERGFHHPGGNDYFLASQLQRYNYTAMEQIYQKEESFVEVLNRIPDGVFTTDNE